MKGIQIGGLSALLLGYAFGGHWSHAQTYPTKPVHIHTAGAGGGSDIASRLVAADLGAALGQAVVVENRPAGLTLPAGVAKAAPDGYTLLVNGATVWTAPLLGEVPYDPIRDFAAITMLTRAPNLLVVTPSLPAKTVADLIKLAKSKPGELNVSTGANGSGTHTGAELFKSLAGVDIVRVSYKDQSQETADLLSGQVQLTFGSGQSMAPLVKAGKLRALGVGGPSRSLLFPDLPAIAEGVPGYLSEAIVGFFAPAKTPDAVVRRLNQETVRVLEKREVRERMINAGTEPGGGAPEEFLNYVKADIVRMGKILKPVN